MEEERIETPPPHPPRLLVLESFLAQQPLPHVLLALENEIGKKTDQTLLQVADHAVGPENFLEYQL